MKNLPRVLLLALLFICAGCAELAVEAPRNAPSLIVVNAKVVTVDDRSTITQAFAVRDGKFLAVGSNEEIRALARAGTQVIDAVIDAQHAYIIQKNSLYRINKSTQTRPPIPLLPRLPHARDQDFLRPTP